MSRLPFVFRLALGVSASAFSPLASVAAVTLVDGGIARAEVIQPLEPSDEERAAARELVRGVLRSTGVELPVRTRRTTGRAAVLIGKSLAPAAAQSRMAGLEGDGYVVECTGDSVVLAGKGREGTSFAVYEFLERFVGARWLWPGDVGEVIPKRDSLTVADFTLAKSPAFLWRDLGPGGALWGPHDRWTKERELGISTAHQAAMRLWERRNRFGGLRVHGGHSFGDILPPAVHGPTHPEYYALVRGERDWKNFKGKHRCQLCTSNPEVVRKAIEYCRTLFETYPSLDGVSISPNDGRGFCECENCTKLDTGRMKQEAGDPEMGRGELTRVITDRMMRFGNQVAEGVGRTHPEKKIVFYAYSQFREPPERTKIHPNLLVIYTVHSFEFGIPEARASAFKHFAAWKSVAPAFGVYEYHTQTNFPDMPRVIPEMIQIELQELQRLGSRYFHTQAGNGFAINGLNFYVLGRLLWDPSADVKAIQADYMQNAFGPAAEVMDRYTNRFIATWRDKKAHSVKMNTLSVADYTAVLGTYPRELRATARQDLEAALKLTSGEQRRRVEFVRDGFRYFELTMEAAEATFPLVQSGWRPGKAAAEAGKVDRTQVDRALELWHQRQRYVEEHREDFVLSYLWVKSGDETRTFNPLRRLDSSATPLEQ